MSYGMVLILSLTNVNSSLTNSVFGSGTLLELLQGMCSDWESSSATVAIVSVFTVFALLLMWAIISVLAGQIVFSELKVTSIAVYRTELSSNESVSLNNTTAVLYR